jgi:hypothetical protein
VATAASSQRVAVKKLALLFELGCHGGSGRAE